MRTLVNPVPLHTFFIESYTMLHGSFPLEKSFWETMETGGRSSSLTVHDHTNPIGAPHECHLPSTIVIHLIVRYLHVCLLQTVWSRIIILMICTNRSPLLLDAWASRWKVFGPIRRGSPFFFTNQQKHSQQWGLKDEREEGLAIEKGDGTI